MYALSLILGCAGTPGAPPVPPAELLLFAHTDRLTDLNTASGDVFDLTTADLDLDGDPDLLLNRHLDHPQELLVNDGTATFQLRNPKGDHSAGLFDNPGVPDLFSDPDPMRAAVADHGGPGVFVWHDLSPADRWRASVVPADAPVRLRVVANKPVTAIDGLQASDTEEIVDEFSVLVTLTGPRELRINTELIGTQLILEALGPDPAVPFFAGTTLAPVDGPVLDLWKDDPHGMAWVDVRGGPEPELVINRGGLIGTLLPPHAPKRDRFFAHTDTDTLYTLQPDVLGANYGRGRQLAWIDLDGDGQDELYAANTETANHLWDFAGQPLTTDHAPALGLDMVGDDTFAALDINGDGRLDVISADGRQLTVHTQRDGGFFATPGDLSGLSWPPEASDDGDGIFNPLLFQAIDFDRDGDLDLLASDFNAIRLFRFEHGKFTDTGDIGLPAPAGRHALLVVDIDADGWMDVVLSDQDLRVARNRGDTFEVQTVYRGTETLPVAAAGDFDQDGTTDIVAFGMNGGVFFENRTPGEAVAMSPDLPRGSVVRAHYADGRVTAQMWGANSLSRYSQGTRPLRLSRPGLVVVTAQVPGSTQQVPMTLPP